MLTIRSNALRLGALSGALSIASVAAGVALLAMPHDASAEDAAPPPPSGHAGPHTPPPEAFTACSSKANGDTCAVTFHDREIAGTCGTPPGDTRLACRPNGPPPAPPEARDACSGKTADEPCTVTLGGRTLTGTCNSGPDGILGCLPPPPSN